MKKIVSLLLAAVIILSLFSVSAFAANGPMPFEEGGGGCRLGIENYEEDASYLIVKSTSEGLAVDNTALAGATYDADSNTLTLTNLDEENSQLYAWHMGDDFKIKVVGTCKLGTIRAYNTFGAYNTNLTLTGSGTLTLNKSKKFESAVAIWSASKKDDTTISIADTLTVNMYSGSAEDNNDIMVISRTKLNNAKKAMTVGGKGIEGVIKEKSTYTEFDEANVMIIRDRDMEHQDGYVAQCKADPDGRYSAYYSEDDNEYVVTHYVYAAEIDMWVKDQDYDDHFAYRWMSPEDFDKEFTIAQSEQTVETLFTTDEKEAERGWQVYQVTDENDPGEVYGAEPYWNNNYDYDNYDRASYEEYMNNPDGYYVYHLIWNSEEGIYYCDEEKRSVQVEAAQMEAKGYGFVYEDVVQNKTFYCWAYPAPFSGENWRTDYSVMNSKTHPETLYVESGKYYNEAEVYQGIVVQEVKYDETYGEYYLPSDFESEIFVPKEEIGEEFSYAMETVSKKKELRYITSYYDFEYYADRGLLVKKAGDNGTYCAVKYDYDGQQYYIVYKLERRENGRYYAVKWKPDDEEYGWGMYQAGFDEQGFSFVTSMQDTPFITVGYVIFDTLNKYTDTEGMTYGVDWDDSVYWYSDNNASMTFGDTTFYLAEPSDKRLEDLISTEHVVDTGCYNYYLRGDEYHHVGAGQSFKRGDVNLDNSVTNKDALILDRKLAKWKGYDEKIKKKETADLNRDDNITNKDSLILNRYLAKWKDYDKYIIDV